MISIIIVFVSIIGIIFFLLYWRWKLLLNEYALPLDIKTFDGSNSPYHPSVLYKENGFFGYNYLMSETPFYFTLPSVGRNYRDQFECPTIHHSKDGIHWVNLRANPIDVLTDAEINDRDYFSDPDLLLTSGGVECWYRLNRRYGREHNQENILLLRRKSVDGVTWSERETIADLQKNSDSNGLGHIVISQTLLFEDSSYKCWYVDNIHLGKERICFSQSSDTTKWEDKTIVKLNGPKITPWHLHIMKDGDVYWLTVYDHKTITLWSGRTEIEFDFVKILLTPSGHIGSFYSHNLYRACLFKKPDNGYRLYFSADDMFRSYLGIMEGETPESMKVISVDGGAHIAFSKFIRLYFKTHYTIKSRKIRYYSRRMIEKPIEIIRGNNG